MQASRTMRIREQSKFKNRDGDVTIVPQIIKYSSIVASLLLHQNSLLHTLHFIRLFYDMINLHQRPTWKLYRQKKIILRKGNIQYYTIKCQYCTIKCKAKICFSVQLTSNHYQCLPLVYNLLDTLLSTQHGPNTVFIFCYYNVVGNESNEPVRREDLLFSRLHRWKSILV